MASPCMPTVTATRTHRTCGLQEKQILDSISEYFKHEIPEVPYNDEDEFLNVLKEAGLTDG